MRASVPLILIALLASPASAEPRKLDLEVVHPILEESLRAAGVTDPIARAKATDRFDRLAESLAVAIGRRASPEAKARRLHKKLHAGTLKIYRADADNPATVLSRGEYNCVSASIVEGLLGRALGLDTWIIAGPQHVFLRVELGKGRSVDIEVTAPDGYDARKHAARAGRLLLAYKLATPEEISARGARAIVDAYQGIGSPIPLEDAPAFVWHNVGTRALARGEAAAAAYCFRQAIERHRGVSLGLEGTEAALAQAFRLAYDAGRFDDAYAIAALGVGLAPDHVSARDRLVAAGVQRIEAAAEAGDPRLAETVLLDVRRLTEERNPRFERSAIPTVIASAIRFRDFEVARRLTERYAAIEPDAAEVARLQRWVALRSTPRP